MIKNNATPRPWILRKEGIKHLGASSWITDKENGSIAQVWGSDKEANANASLIVNAVNCHDGLIAACRWALACIEDENTNLKTFLEEALAKAGAI